MFGKSVIIGLCLTVSAVFAQQNDRVELGRLQTGTTVSFVHAAGGEWGIEIAGAAAPRILQPKPAMIEVYNTETDIRQLDSGYKTVEKSTAGIDALAEIAYGDNVIFRVRDNWSLNGAVVSVSRKVEVTGNAPGGFYSSVILTIDPSVNWTDVNCLAPGLLYGDPTYDGDRSPGGIMNYRAKCFMMREDILSAPLFALSFKNGCSVAVLDPSPRGDTTVEETPQRAVMTDARFQFGALGAWQTDNNPIEFGFVFPGTTRSSGGGFGRRGGTQPTAPRWTRRYHPISQGLVHTYQVSFRFGQNENFRDVTRNAWRWAWNTLNPPIIYIDVEQMRKVLLDHLVAQANTIDGRTAMPFVINSITDEKQWNYTMVAMGFVGKDIECADQLLREGDRDKTERGQKMRQTGLAIISSLIQALPTVPLQGTGYNLATGKPWGSSGEQTDNNWTAPWLRNATEDMRVLMRAYRREKAQGRDHPEWFNWVKQYVDWLILQQREDGSFPRRWERGSSEVAEPTGTASYCPVPLLVLMTDETKDPKYKESAIRAAEYVWTNFGRRGLFIGGAIDNPNITDKEAGMLSMEAFLSLYDSTKETKWLERAQAAANFAESWIWIWQVPMPADANDAQLHWKKGVPALGFQGITAQVSGGVDEYLDWAVPSYAKLYKLTNDQHYYDVARLLLHDTKQMVALPGRQYDYKGIGWQQEGWSMSSGSRRGVGGHRFWLPWISANHLYGITGLEEYDPVLFKNLSGKN
jgi:hypothetical protein